MTPEQKFHYHRKTGKLPPENKPKKVKTTHGVVVHCGQDITEPLPWALAQHRLSEFKRQGYKNIRLRTWEGK